MDKELASALVRLSTAAGLLREARGRADDGGVAGRRGRREEEGNAGEVQAGPEHLQGQDFDPNIILARMERIQLFLNSMAPAFTFRLATELSSAQIETEKSKSRVKRRWTRT